MTGAAESEDKRGDRDHDGRFRPGHRLGGRPRGVDLRALVDERAASDPTIGSTDDLLWGVVVVLARRAATGDVQAARLLLDRLAAPPDEPSAVGATMTDREVAERLAVILRRAAARQALEEGRPPASEGAFLGGLA